MQKIKFAMRFGNDEEKKNSTFNYENKIELN